MKTDLTRILAVFILSSGLFSANAQEAKPAVVANCGANSQAITGYTISFTVGETIIVTAGNDAVLTQGFHQPLSANEYPFVSLNLSATTMGNHTQLNWTTSSEINNDWFFIERSGNGSQFSIIDNMRTKAVNGNSTSPVNYEYADLQPLNGTNYYRVKEVSKNGAIRYSEIVQVIFSSTLWRATIYPNPVSGTLFMQLFSALQTKTRITLHNLAGQLVLRRELDLPQGYSKQSLEMGHLKAGIYILSVVDSKTNRTIRVKLIKR